MSGSTSVKKTKAPAAKTGKTAKPAAKSKYVSRFDAFDDQGTLPSKKTKPATKGKK